jgi:tetratricopeptide (TPR) repeat protein
VKKISGYKANVAVVAVAIGAAFSPARLIAQPPPASVHGHVQNAAGIALTKGDVKFTKDKTSDPKDRKYPFVFPIDSKGDYKGTGLTPGDYVAIVFVDDKSIDFMEVTFKEGDDKTVDLDETRKEFLAKMSPEDLKALEEYKKKNAEIVAGNQKVQTLNQSLASARADIKSGSFDTAAKTMQDAVAAKPDEAVLWVTLGDAQLGIANAASKAARDAHTSTMDVAIVAKFQDAAKSYKKGIETNAASKKPNLETEAVAYNQLGQCEGKSGNAKEASDAYEKAATLMPANAGMYFFNEAATLFNADKKDEAAVAADKAIAADPKKADAYYIKGQSLVGKSTVDPKTQKIVAPAGCMEAYQKYLEVAPDGPHAKEVTEILTGFGQTVRSTYKSGTKK